MTTVQDFALLPALKQVLVVFSVLLPTFFIYNFFFHPLAKLPGPVSARLGLPYFRVTAAFTRTYSWRLKELHDKYGDTIRIGTNSVSTIEPKAVHAIYAHDSNFYKTRFYSAFQVLKTRPSLFSDIDPHSHASRRRAIASVYSMKSLVDLEEYVDPCITVLLEALDRMIASSAPRTDDAEKPKEKVGSLDMSRWMHFLAADAIGELAFGRSLGLLRSGKDRDSYLSAFSNLSVFACVAGCMPSISYFINCILRRTTSATPAVIREITWDRVNERYEDATFFDENGEPRRKDMLSGFIKSKYPETKEPFSQEEVAAVATSVFTAGSDTTAAALASFFYFMLRNPAIYARVQAEVDEAFEEGRLQVPVQHAQGVKLAYLQACVKEALRLVPSVGMEMPRFVPPEGMVAGGHFLPGGTEIGAIAFAFHRSEEIFGPDAGEFRPGRWLDVGEDERAQMERNFISFGAGSRICIGKHISLMEISKVLPILLHRYKFSATPRSPSSPHQYQTGKGLYGLESEAEPWRIHYGWLTQMEDFWCDVTLRTPDEDVLSLLST